jgi:hypothetical protein
MSKLTKTEESNINRIYQGDIFSNVEIINSVEIKNDSFTMKKIKFPLVAILTQDCDLNSDNLKRSGGNGSLLLSVIILPIFNIEHFYDGSYLENLGIGMVPSPVTRKITKSQNKEFKDNENPRYHYLDFIEHINEVESVIDFKYYFTIDIEYLINLKKNGNCLGKINEIYRERLSQRFAEFLSRIGLPD